MGKKSIGLLCLLIASACVPAATHATVVPHVLVGDFYGDGQLGDVGAALAAACRTALGPASIQVSRIVLAMHVLGMDPSRGLLIDSRQAQELMQQTGAGLLVSGQLTVCPTEILLIIRFSNNQGTTLALDRHSVSSWQGWPSFVGGVVSDVARRARVKEYPAPPEAMRPCLRSYGRAIKARMAGEWGQALRSLSQADTQNPAMTRYLEQSGEVRLYLDQAAKSRKQKAELLMESGQAQEAAALLAPQAGKEGDADIQLLYGTALQRSGKPREAVTVLEPAARAAPDRSDLRIAMAGAQAQAGEYGKAEASLRTITESGKEDPDVTLALADIVQNSGRIQEAAELNTMAAREFASQGRRSEANEALVRAMTQDPSQRVRIEDLDPDYLTVGQARTVQSQLLHESTARDATPSGLYARGVLLPTKGREAEAEKALRAYLDAVPENGPANREMGRLLASQNNYEESLRHWEKAATSDGTAEGLLHLTQAYQAQGRHDMALKTLGKLAAGAKDPNTQAVVLQSLSLLETGKTSEAKLLLNSLLQAQPDNVPAHRMMARAYAASGWNEGAQLEIKKAAALDPEGILMPRSNLGAPTPDEGRVIKAPVVPNCDTLAEALELLFESFDTLKDFPKGEREYVWVGMDVQGLGEQPFYHVHLWRKDLFVQDAAWVLAHKMYFSRLLSPPQVSSSLSQQNGENEILKMIAQGLTLNVLLTVKSGEKLKIEAKVYNATNSGEWENSVSLDPVGLYALQRLNIPLVGLLVSPLVFVLLLAVAFFIRGWGTLIVEEEHDLNVGRALFSVLISRKKLGPPLRKGDEQNYVETIMAQGRHLSRYSGCMVGRKTVFKKLPAGSYYVYFYGVIVDSNVPIGSYSLEKAVRVKRNQEETATFDLRPKEATIHLHTFFQGQICHGAEVWVNNNRNLSIYIKDDMSGGSDGAVLRLPKGQHTIHVAFRDLLVSRTVNIDEFSNQQLVVEVTEPDPRQH